MARLILSDEERKERQKLWSAKYRAKNREKLHQSSAEYRKANKDKIAAKNAAYAKANPEKCVSYKAKWAKANREKMRLWSASFAKANPDKRRIYEHNRRERASASGKLSVDLAKKLLALQKGKCACCGKPLNDGYHLDHIMPLALGGANTDDNIQLLSKKCNSQKRAKHPVDFMQQRGFLL